MVKRGSMLVPHNKSVRDSLYREVDFVVSRYGNLTVHERQFVLRLVAHKLTERRGGDGRE